MARSKYVEWDNDDLIFTLAYIYDRTTKKAVEEATKIVKELARRGIISNPEQFMIEWQK